ncbi:TAP-like protein-domain-containing protein [Obelidium mucronatum]|nr:TAP-like protein-domain-containing protein [Obelidium mucronatum]
MELSTLLLTLSSASLALAQASSFNWKSCPGKDEGNFKCGSLTVPLDYSNRTSSKTIDIAVSLYKAQILPSLGTIAFNFGGPGAPGKSVILQGGEYASFMTGGRYDILGFEQFNNPSSKILVEWENPAPVSCFKTPLHHAYFTAQASVLTPPFSAGSDTSLTVYAGTQEALANGCGIYSKDILPYLGTSYVARDMDEIRKALGEEVLNYYGFSYGSTLGVVYANMFPDRLGRAVIDGGMSVAGYMTEPLFSMNDDTADLEQLLDAFGKECDIAGPTSCPLAKANEKSSAKRVRQFLKKLETKPLAVKNGEVPGILDVSRAEKVLLDAMYTPYKWPTLAQAFADAISGDPTLLFNLGLSDLSTCPAALFAEDMGFNAVICADSKGNDADLNIWKAAAKKADKVSFAGQSMIWSYLVCKYWPTQAAEQFSGPWNKKLKNKLLIIGNTLDPVTPLRHAKAVERIMAGNAVLLQQDGYGHCSSSQISSCTLGYTQQLFTNGTYPEKGAKCKVDGIPIFQGLSSALKAFVGEKSGAELLANLIAKYN